MEVKEFYEIINDILTEHGKKVNDEHIYHYTNAAGLKSILEGKTLWFSERNYMNDIYDEKYIQNYVKNKGFNKDIIKNLEVTTPQYIFSTSLEKDLIHQWSYYGGNDAYCIELDRTKLICFLYNAREKEEEFYYGPVFYIKDKKSNDDSIKIIDDVITEYINSTKKDAEEYKKVYRYFYSLVKQYGHYCEKEYRFVFHTKREAKFRVRNGLFIPYIEIFNNKSSNVETHDNEEKQPLPITKIMIGPSNHEHIAEKSLRLFLDKNGYGSIKIEKSKMNIRN